MGFEGRRVSEPEARSRADETGILEHGEIGIERDSAQRDDHANIREERQLADEKRTASQHLLA